MRGTWFKIIKVIIDAKNIAVPYTSVTTPICHTFGENAKIKDDTNDTKLLPVRTDIIKNITTAVIETKNADRTLILYAKLEYGMSETNILPVME